MPRRTLNPRVETTGAPRRIWMAVAVASAGMLVFAQAPTTSDLPPTLDRYARTVARLTASEMRTLRAGAPVSKLLEARTPQEVAVLGAVWIAAPVARYIEAVRNIEQFERGAGFNITRRIGTPPVIEDFAELRLTEEDVADLRTCRVGDCDIKLSEEALKRFRTEIDWKAPNRRAAAEALMRRILLEYVTRYLEGGNERLAVYRDQSRPTSVAQEFRAMVDAMPELAAHMPALRQYLLEYPAVRLPDATSFLYWQETAFGLKPTIRISHLTIREGAAETIVASKMLYASHYFWTGLELRLLLRDPARGEGFWFVTVSRSRTDGMSGFTGLFVRRRVRHDVEAGTLSVLKTTKRRLETSR